MSRTYAALPFDYLEEMEALTDEEFGKLCRALLRYSMDGEAIPTDGNLRFVAKAAMNRADKYIETFDKIDDRNRGGAPKGNNNAKKQPKTTENNLKQPKTTENNLKQPVVLKNNPEEIIKGNIESKKENEIEKEKEGEREKREAAAPLNSHEVLDLWNSTCINLNPVSVMTDKRKDALHQLIASHGEEKIRTVFDAVSKSAFLHGENHRKWKASFDWVINQDNFAKILEGNYDDDTDKRILPPSEEVEFLTRHLRRNNNIILNLSERVGGEL